MKRKITSGNYTPKREALVDAKEPKMEFEEEALKKLGGSIAFVKGRKLVEG